MSTACIVILAVLKMFYQEKVIAFVVIKYIYIYNPKERYSTNLMCHSNCARTNVC